MSIQYWGKKEEKWEKYKNNTCFCVCFILEKTILYIPLDLKRYKLIFGRGGQ